MRPCRQRTTIADYVEELEKFMGFLMNGIPWMTEDYFLEYFIRHLKEDIRCFVEFLSPTNLSSAIILAEMQEEFLEKQAKKSETLGLQLENKNAPENGFVLHSNSELGCALIEQKIEEKWASKGKSLASNCSAKWDINKSIQEDKELIHDERTNVLGIVIIGGVQADPEFEVNNGLHKNPNSPLEIISTKESKDGLITSSSTSLQTYDQFRQKLKEEMVLENEVIAKVFSEKISDNKAVPEGQVSEKAFCSPNLVDGEEKWRKQILKIPSIIHDKMELDSELDCPITKASFVENSGSEEMQKMVLSVGEKLDVSREIHRATRSSLKIEELDEITITETALQCGLTRIAIVWFRGPDPGGTCQNPFPYSLHFYP